MYFVCLFWFLCCSNRLVALAALRSHLTSLKDRPKFLQLIQTSVELESGSGRQGRRKTKAPMPSRRPPAAVTGWPCSAFIPGCSPLEPLVLQGETGPYPRVT